jgi:predicted TPR repeat methyltransferase
MSTFDAYRVTDQLDDVVLDAIATRLEVRGRHPVFVRMLDEYLDAMSIDEATAIIDLGCGTGVAARRIAGRSAFSGHATGIDRSPYLIDVATTKALRGRLTSGSAIRRASISATASSMPSSPIR